MSQSSQRVSLSLSLSLSLSFLLVNVSFLHRGIHAFPLYSPILLSDLLRICVYADAAVKELRKKGLAAATKKSSRHAAEGLVGLALGPSGAAVVEINSETDFVARNEMFQSLVHRSAASILQSLHERPQNAEEPLASIDADSLGEMRLDDGNTIEEGVAQVAGVVRENIKLRRGFSLALPETSSGLIGSYVHARVSPNVGRIASLVMLEVDPQEDGRLVQHRSSIEDLAHKLALHVAGATPHYLNRDEVPESALEAERKLLMDQASRSGKPPQIVAKMVEGRLGKFYEAVCLLEQPFIMDDKRNVKQIVETFGKEKGIESVRVSKFLRCQVGEGLEATESKGFVEQVEETLQEAKSST